jgi:hypothetical protein
MQRGRCDPNLVTRSENRSETRKVRGALALISRCRIVLRQRVLQIITDV